MTVTSRRTAALDGRLLAGTVDLRCRRSQRAAERFPGAPRRRRRAAVARGHDAGGVQAARHDAVRVAQAARAAAGAPAVDAVPLLVEALGLLPAALHARRWRRAWRGRRP